MAAMNQITLNSFRNELEKIGEEALAIRAYITGPSGGGKTTYAKKFFPGRGFTTLHTDSYEYFVKQRKGRPRRKVDWKKLIAAAKASKKPVVIEGMDANKKLLRIAQERIVVDPGMKRVLAQRAGRGRSKKDPAWKGRKLYRTYRLEVRPVVMKYKPRVVRQFDP